MGINLVMYVHISTGEGSEHNFDGNHDQTSINNGDFSSNPSTNTALSEVSVSRTGSGASGTSVVNLGLMEGKHRCCYKHLQLLKLQEIKQVCSTFYLIHLLFFLIGYYYPSS